MSVCPTVRLAKISRNHKTVVVLIKGNISLESKFEVIVKVILSEMSKWITFQRQSFPSVSTELIRDFNIPYRLRLPYNKSDFGFFFWSVSPKL